MTAKSAPPVALTWSGVTARRMARHALTGPATDLDPAGVARVLCGAHAQVLSAAELSIGRRIAGATRATVQRALWQERTLVRTFGPRGTIHLLPAADLPIWTGALSALPSSVPALRSLDSLTPCVSASWLNGHTCANHGRLPRQKPIVCRSRVRVGTGTGSWLSHNWSQASPRLRHRNRAAPSPRLPPHSHPSPSPHPHRAWVPRDSMNVTLYLKESAGCHIH